MPIGEVVILNVGGDVGGKIAGICDKYADTFLDVVLFSGCGW